MKHHMVLIKYTIPAKMTSGDANEEQILVAAMACSDQQDVLQQAL